MVKLESWEVGSKTVTVTFEGGSKTLNYKEFVQDVQSWRSSHSSRELFPANTAIGKLLKQTVCNMLPSSCQKLINNEFLPWLAELNTCCMSGYFGCDKCFEGGAPIRTVFIEVVTTLGRRHKSGLGEYNKYVTKNPPKYTRHKDSNETRFNWERKSEEIKRRLMPHKKLSSFGSEHFNSACYDGLIERIKKDPGNVSLEVINGYAAFVEEFDLEKMRCSKEQRWPVGVVEEPPPLLPAVRPDTDRGGKPRKRKRKRLESETGGPKVKHPRV